MNIKPPANTTVSDDAKDAARWRLAKSYEVGPDSSPDPTIAIWYENKRVYLGGMADEVADMALRHRYRRLHGRWPTNDFELYGVSQEAQIDPPSQLEQQ